MSDKPSSTSRDCIPGQPDVNAGALRPTTKPDANDPRPDIDHPPRGEKGDTPGFDQAETAHQKQARDGTLPGSDDGAGNPRSGEDDTTNR